MRQLNPQQHEAAVAPADAPLKIIAGAGTGKTETLARRFVSLVDSGLQPAQILMLTFTEKAAAEMRGRVMARLLERPGLPAHALLHPWIHTFHGFCARVLAGETLRLRLSTPPQVLEDWQQRECWETIWQSFEQTMLVLPGWQPYNAVLERAFDWHSGQLSGRVVSLVEQLRALGLDASALDMIRPSQEHERHYRRFYSQLRPLLGHCLEAYQSLLAQQGALDFAALVLSTLRLLERQPEAAQRLRRRFGAILVDEFQDTDRAQLRLLGLLDPGFCHTTVVGDPRQALYGWRQARVDNLIAFPEDGQPARNVALRLNYRSAAPICELANLALAGYQPDPAHPEFDLADGLIPAPQPMADQAEQHVELRIVESLRDEAAYIAETARQLREQGYLYQEMALLLRSRTHLKLYEEALLQARVPYQVVGGIGFYEQSEVRDTLALLRLLDAPDDTLALLRLLESDLVGLPDRALVEARRDQQSGRSRQEPLPSPEDPRWLERWQQLLDPAWPGRLAALDRLSWFAGFYQELRRLSLVSTPAALLQIFWRRSGIRQRLITAATSVELPDIPLAPPGMDMRRLLSLEKLLRLAQDYQAREPLGALHGLAHFLARLSAGAESLPSLHDGGDTLQLMTIHAAKGREFDVVFLGDTRLPRFGATNVSRSFFDERFGLVISDEKTPDPAILQLRAEQSRRALNEERCIWYVALTRARRRLFVLHDVARCDVVRPETRFAPAARQEHFFHQLWNQLLETSADWRSAVALVDRQRMTGHGWHGPTDGPRMGTDEARMGTDSGGSALTSDVQAAGLPEADAAQASDVQAADAPAHNLSELIRASVPSVPSHLLTARAMAARIAELRARAETPVVRLSFSAWDSYQLCPHQYRARFLFRWEQLLGQIGDADLTVAEHTLIGGELPGVWPQALGLALHRALAYAARQPGQPVLDQALAIYLDELQRLGESPEPYLEEGQRVLRLALADQALWAARARPYDLERRFTLRASAGSQVVLLSGVIDRIDHAGGRWRMVDYKWSAQLDREGARRQLGLYRLAWNELMPGQDEPDLYVYDLRQGQLIRLDPLPPEELALSLSSMAAELNSEQARFARRPGDYCQRCPVRRLDSACGK